MVWASLWVRREDLSLRLPRNPDRQLLLEVGVWTCVGASIMLVMCEW